MPRTLKELRIDEVSSVDRGAGEGVTVLLTKRAASIYNKPLTFGATLPPEVEAYIKREFSDKERQAAADSGAALPDGSFPIKNKQDLKNAIQAIGRAKDPAKAKAHIKTRARALGATDLIPESWGKRAAEIIDFSAARRSVVKNDFTETLAGFEVGEDAGALMSELNEALYALNMSVCSILDDDDASDKPAAVAESFSQFQAHVAALALGSTEDTEKAAMTTPAEQLKKQIDDAVAAAVAKASETYTAQIAKLSDELVVAKMSDKHKAYMDSLPSDTEKAKFKGMSPADRDDAMSKAVKRAEDEPVYKALKTENEDLKKRLDALENGRDLEICKQEAKAMGVTITNAGELLQKVKKGNVDAIAEWNKALMEATSKLTKQRDEAQKLGKVFDELGYAGGGEGRTDDPLAKLNEKAAELRKTQPELTEAQAFAKVLTDPANAELAKAERDGRMNRIHKVAA